MLGKSIRLFSQLLSTELYFEPMVIKHKLFKTFVPAENVSDTDEKTVIAASTVTATELVIGLVKMLSKPEYSISTSMYNAIEKMKALAIESGIVEPQADVGEGKV